MKIGPKKVLSNFSVKSKSKSFLSFIFLILLIGTGCNGDSQKSITTDSSQLAKSVTTEEIELLKRKIQVLEDKDAIWSLLSRYSLNVDLGRAENFLRLFTDDCVFATDIGGKISYRRGKKELAEMVASPPPKGQHLQLDYHINVDGDTATAVGYQDLTSLRGNSVNLGRAAFRFLKFRRVEGVWLIQEVYTIGIDNEAEYLKILPSDL